MKLLLALKQLLYPVLDGCVDEGEEGLLFEPRLTRAPKSFTIAQICSETTSVACTRNTTGCSGDVKSIGVKQSVTRLVHCGPRNAASSNPRVLCPEWRDVMNKCGLATPERANLPDHGVDITPPRVPLANVALTVA